MPKAPTKAQLESVANDFNRIMKLEPPIETGKNTKVDGLRKDVVEAANELSAEDKLSKETLATLAALEVEVPKPKPAAGGSGSKPATPPKPRYSRITAAVEAVGNVGKADLDQVVNEANKLYIAQGGKDNPGEAKWAVNMSLKVMTAMRELKVKA